MRLKLFCKVGYIFPHTMLDQWHAISGTIRSIIASFRFMQKYMYKYMYKTHVLIRVFESLREKYKYKNIYLVFFIL